MLASAAPPCYIPTFHHPAGVAERRSSSINAATGAVCLGVGGSIGVNSATERFRWRVSSSSGSVVCMAPEEEKITRRSPLDFPIEWERPKPGRRPDIFPKFSPMKTPLPPPIGDPPEEDEDEEEEKKEEGEEETEKEEEPEKPPKEI